MTSYRRPPRKLNAYSTKLLRDLHATRDRHREEDRILLMPDPVMSPDDLARRYRDHPVHVSPQGREFIGRLMDRQAS